MIERERLAAITSGIRAELIERGVIKNAKGYYICSCGKETKEKYLGKCPACDTATRSK